MGQWAGTWKAPGVEQGLPLRLARGMPPPTPAIQGLDGDWQGAINVRAVSGPALTLIAICNIIASSYVRT